MSDHMTGMQGPEPTEEELRAYLLELRQADPAEFVMQAVNILVTGAQAKIGMADGRLLIDALSGLVDGAVSGLPQELAAALGQAVAQLQTAQVQAEAQLGGASPAEGGTPSAPGAPSGAPAAQPTVSEPKQKMTDRLWIPGQGTPPPAR
jgi:hypothetical protein